MGDIEDVNKKLDEEFYKLAYYFDEYLNEKFRDRLREIKEIFLKEKL